MSRLILFSLINLLALAVNAQEKVPGIIEGKVSDGNRVPIPFANIRVKGTTYGAACNYYGVFRIAVISGDTLQVTAISYATREFVVPEGIDNKRFYLDIILTDDTIMLAEVSVHPWPETYREFREAFLGEIPGGMEIPPLNFGIPGPGELRNEAYSQGGIIMPGPVSVLYDLLSKEARNRRKYQELLRNDWMDTLLNRKYNPAIVARLTGLRSTQDVDSLMKFCDLKPELIMSLTEYELYTLILQCQRKFEAKKSEKQ